MGLALVGGTSGVNADVDAAAKALRTILYAADGSPLVLADRGAIVPGVSQGIPIMGRDGPVARVLRVGSNGELRDGAAAPLFFDSVEGVSVDTNKWVQTLTTMAVVQSIATGTLFNAASSVATATGAMHFTQSRFPFIGRSGLLFKARVMTTAHFANNVIELGFGAPPSVTGTTIGDGACWRKDGSGQWVPVITLNGGTDILGTPISDVTFRAAIAVTDYAAFEVFLEDCRARFRIFRSDGTIVNEQVLNFQAGVGVFGVTRLQAFERIYNAGAVATAVQMRVAHSSVWYTDSTSPTAEQLAVWNCNGSLTSPTAYTQLSSYANSTAPASAALSNTAAGYATLGGQWQFATVAGAETDYALFAFQVPTPFGLTITRVQIDAINTGAAVATSASLIQWGLAFGSSAVSLATAAPYAPMRKAIGYHSWAIGAAIGQGGGPSIVWQGREKVQPGRFFHAIAKLPIGTATAAQILRGTCSVEGFFE